MILRLERTAAFPLIFVFVILTVVLTAMSIHAMPGSGMAALVANSVPSSFDDDDGDTILSEGNLRRYAAQVRAGFSYGPMLNAYDKQMNKYYDDRWGIMVDGFFYRIRSNRGNGIDFYARFTYRNFVTSRMLAARTADLQYYVNKAYMPGLDVGVRAIYGFYFLKELWQAYVIVAPRFVYYRLSLSQDKRGGKDVVYNMYSIGVIGGVGIEVSIISHLGIFAEYTIGYTPVGSKKRNIDGHQAWVGLTWRTPVRR